MNRVSFLSSSAAGAIAAVALAGAPQAALAQSAGPDTAGIEGSADGSAARADEPIVVTGSRIRRPNLDATVPITSLPSDLLTETANLAAGDVLNNQPSIRSTVSQQNSFGVSNFAAGLNFLDLRGLGVQRTLVLQNGRRLPPAAIGRSSPDINIVPSDLIDRVDIVTGGNSAVYGSDAVAGVVNFVMKRDFEGLEARAQAGVSERGDAGSYRLSGLAGTNFAGGLGNVALNVEYARQESASTSGRKLMEKSSGFGVVDADVPAQNSDGIPDRNFFVGFTSPTVAYGGQLTPNCNAGTRADRRDARCLPGGNVARLYYFQPDGRLVEGPYGDRDFRPLQNQILNGQGTNGRRFGENELRPDLERITANLLARYTVSDAFEPFVELLYARTDVRVGNGGASFFQGGLQGGIGAAAVFRLDNPYLTDQARAVIQQFVDPGTTTFQVSRALLEAGIRTAKPSRDTYRAVFGVRGEFMDDWNYEISANYGRYDEDLRATGYINYQRLAYALDAARSPTTGQIVCRVQFDPAARATIRNRINFAGTVSPDAAALALANEDADVAQCVPFNAFGEGAASPEARAYVAPLVSAHSKSRQFVLNGFVSGDTSSFFDLPGGPVGFAVGAEYRRETAFQRFDPLTEAGLNFANQTPVFDPPAFAVKEAFAEIRLPILADMPLFHELTIEAAGRVADYRGATGTVFAWNAGGSYAPVPDLRFRGNYSVAVRAPNLADLYAVRTSSFSSGFNDPCSIQFIGAGSSTRAANCLAAGIPAGFNRLAGTASAQPIVEGGNPNLREERSKSWTVGAVFTPRFVPGFSASVDYYDIKIEDVVAASSAQIIANACYDAATLNNPYCGQLTRFSAGSVASDGSSNAFFIDRVESTTFNFGKYTARGVDFELAYQRQLPSIGVLSLRGVATRVLERANFIFADQPNRPDRILSETGDPKWASNLNVDLQSGPVKIGYQLRYLGRQLIAGNAAENVFTVGGNPPFNADFADPFVNPDVFYHDIRVEFEATDDFNFYAGVQNIGDRLPPFGQVGTADNTGIYENIGRYFFAGAVAKF